LLNVKLLNLLIKWFININSICCGRITQRSTGRQKQARFLPVGKLLVKGRYRFKSYSFFAFAACELGRYSLYFIQSYKIYRADA